MPGVRRFEDFDCWKLSNELKINVYQLVERPHIKSDEGFCEQIKSAVASAPANIAEGF
jgi:four helix bundle protein